MKDKFEEIRYFVDAVQKNFDLSDKKELKSRKKVLIRKIQNIKIRRKSNKKQQKFRLVLLSVRFSILNNFSDDFYITNTRVRNRVVQIQAFSFLVHKIYGITSILVGKYINRDHATVLHSCKIVQNQFKYYKKYLRFWKNEIEEKTDLRF